MTIYLWLALTYVSLSDLSASEALLWVPAPSAGQGDSLLSLLLAVRTEARRLLRKSLLTTLGIIE